MEGNMYRTSKYNIYYKDYVFNTRQRSLIKANKQLIKLLRNNKLSEIGIEQLRILESLGFVILSNMDELQLFEFWYRNLKYDKRVLSVTYIPGYLCNSACKYCYASSIIENPKLDSKIPLSEEVFLNWLERMVAFGRPLKLDFSFHGGEPLVYKNKLLSIARAVNEIGEKYKVEVKISIVTNGTLLNLKTLLQLREVGISNFLITLDGPNKIHNFRRPLKKNLDSFNIIINNISNALDQGVDIFMSQNVDSHNKEYVKELLDLFFQKGFYNYRNFHYVIAAVKYGPDYESLPYFDEVSPLSQQEYAKIKLEAYKNALEMGFNIALPIGTGICSLKQINTFIVDVYGDVYKCVTLTGHEDAKLGRVDEPVEVLYQRSVFFDSMEPWKDNEKCLKCKYLPLCHGGCMQQAKIAFPEHPMGTKVNCIEDYLNTLFPEVIEIIHTYWRNIRHHDDSISNFVDSL